MSIRISGTGAALPQKTVSNEDLSLIMDTSDKWIKERTGISNRHICTTESLVDLAYAAADEALKNADIPIHSIDYILFSTLGGDYITPSMACATAQRLQAVCPALDINGACTGFIYCLDMAQALIDSKKAENILIICAEKMSAYTDWTDRATSVLFGDGAGACVVQAGEALLSIGIDSTPDAEILKLEYGDGNNPFISQENQGKQYLYMDGRAVFKYAVESFERHMKRASEEMDLSKKDIDMYLLHQANLRIIEFARARLGAEPEKFPTNIGEYGNMSSATIPILLHELLQAGKISKGDRLFLSAFGAGLTSGYCVLDWE